MIQHTYNIHAKFQYCHMNGNAKKNALKVVSFITLAYQELNK
jgi:hypothetical protein